MPAAQGKHEPPSKPTFVRRAQNQVYHFDMLIARPQLTAGQQGNCVRDTVKVVIGDNLSVLPWLGTGDYDDVLRLGGRHRHDAGL